MSVALRVCREKRVHGRIGAGVIVIAGALILVVGLLGWIVALEDSRDADRRTGGAIADRENPHASGVDLVGASDALDDRVFGGTNVGGLSALTYDPRRDLYYSLVDRERGTPARFYTLRLALGRTNISEPEIVKVTTLTNSEGQPLQSGNFDGEGIAVSDAGELFIASETEPAIRRFSPDGSLLAGLPVPSRFLVDGQDGGQTNGTFESLALSPDGRVLFTANQAPLAPDGMAPDGRSRLRLLRYQDQGGADFDPAAEFFYLAEPDGGGIADIAAVSEDEILVLEHDQKIFRVSLAGAEDVSDERSLRASELKPVEKELMIDLANCPVGENILSPPENYEGLALGPPLPDGRRALLVQSDDGFSAGLTTWLVALSVRLQQSSDMEAGSCE